MLFSVRELAASSEALDDPNGGESGCLCAKAAYHTRRPLLLCDERRHDAITTHKREAGFPRVHCFTIPLSSVLVKLLSVLTRPAWEACCIHAVCARKDA